MYITHSDPDYKFAFATPEGQLMNVTTSEVNNVGLLPTQCKGGYIVKVVNSDSSFDDYYARFETENEGIDGPGTWVETVKPGIKTVINAGTMPHIIFRRASGVFEVKPLDWEPRRVGDDDTNPIPSFVSPDNGNLRNINKTVFFRNRLCMISGDNIVCSKPGDYYNFFAGTALEVAPNDPIDIAVGSTSSSENAILYDAIEVSDGLLCFTNTEQFLLSTDSEVFGPRTARFNRVGTFRSSGQNGTHVFSLGTTVGFLGDSGINSRLMEMYNISRAGNQIPMN